ncbi:cytochrome P450 [Nocardia sp. NBC_00565]|uniref:cytochrome P450 n=1 Tax=Nocardia sp. NBC_00565 TaxID=2975993 RepID=UPI002E80A266|nr:cytochrome P450 [Nocardia sp. NBC_00565]WUC03358.1 cytochrome P450 [Nocardia sp. NBC_00565]
MHIAMFMDYHPTTLGGVQTAVRALCRGLERAGHRVTLFVAPQPGAAAVPDVVELHAAALAVNGFPVVLPGKRNDGLIDAAFAARGPIDLVHTHTTYGVAIAGMKAARRHRLPLVHTAQSRDDAFIEHTAPAPYPAALAMRALHGRFVPHRRHMPRRPESRAARHAWWTIVGQAQAADQVIAPTHHFAELLLAHGLTRPIRVVSNGVDDELLDGRGTAEHPANGPLRLIWSGRLSAEKRLLESIEAVRRAENCTLDIYGEGDLRAAAAAVIAEHRLADRIRVHGRVTQAENIAAMAESDALLFPSLGFDTQGMVLLEAVAVRLPIIYCDPDLDESVPADGGIRTGDPSAAGIAETITELAADRATLAEMRTVLDKFGDSVLQSRQTGAVLEIYRQAAEQSAQSPELVMPQDLSEVPTAPGHLPLLGHSLRALRDAPGFVTSLSELGPIVRIHFDQKIGYLLTTPDLVREVGLGDAELNRDDLREAIEDVAGGSVNVLRGEEHKLRRRMIAPALRQSRLAEYTKAAAEIAETWSAGLPSGGRVNLMDEAHGLVLDTVTSTLFTAEFSAAVRREIRDNVPWLLSQVIMRTALPPQVRRLRLIANWRWRTKARRLRGAIGAAVAEYRRRDEDFNDVVSALIRHTDPETGATLSNEHIIDEAILMLAGGVGSMASLAGWLWHEVMRRPHIAERVYAELDTVVGSGPVRAEHINTLPYLKQVVSETLRFWGPWISAGTADGDVTVGGLTIPDGTAIMFSPYMVQHDKRYFANPESFDPDRWSPERADEIDKKANLSFGVGRRRCLGDHFALLEITLASAAFLNRWRPIPDPKYVVRASNRDFVLSPSALPVTLRPR